ncbi:MAG: hydrogenase maturation protease [Bacteroidota bacterium]|mgnify:FL=1
MESIAILGIGNPYVSDDGVGVYVVRELKEKINDQRVVCTELTVSGLDALEHLTGFDGAIIIDAAKTGIAPVGHLWTISQVQASSLSHSLSLHTLGLQASIRLGSMMGLPIPLDMTIFAVEVSDTETFHEGCTPEVELAIPNLTSIIIRFLKSKLPDLRCSQQTHEEQQVDGSQRPYIA